MDIFLSYLGNGGLFASLAISERQIPICIDATGKADLECTFLLSSDFLARNYCEGLTQQFSFFFAQLHSSDNKSNVLGISFQVKIFIISEQKAFTAVVELNYESQR